MRKFILLAVLTFILAQCTGGSNPPPPNDNVELHPYLQFQPPKKWVEDNTIELIPKRDLKCYWIYAKPILENRDFIDNDCVASVNMLDNNGNLMTEWNLDLLSPHVQPGVYEMSIKVESNWNKKSDFSYSDNELIWERK